MIASTRSNSTRFDESPGGMGENVANLASDLMTLAELQTKLLWLDLQQSRIQAQFPLVMIVTGILTVLGVIPVAILSLGDAVASSSELPQYAARLIVAGGFLLVAIIAVWQGAAGLARATRTLERSKAELQDNLTWIKKVIQQTTTSNRRS